MATRFVSSSRRFLSRRDRRIATREVSRLVGQFLEETAEEERERLAEEELDDPGIWDDDFAIISCPPPMIARVDDPNDWAYWEVEEEFLNRSLDDDLPVCVDEVA